MSTYNKKGGRPPVEELRYKEYIVSTRLDAAGHLRLEELKQKSGKSAAEVIRELIINGQVREKMRRVHLEFMGQLKGIARNLNQLTRLANAIGYKAAEQKLTPIIASCLRTNASFIRICARIAIPALRKINGYYTPMQGYTERLRRPCSGV